MKKAKTKASVRVRKHGFEIARIAVRNINRSTTVRFATEFRIFQKNPARPSHRQSFTRYRRRSGLNWFVSLTVPVLQGRCRGVFNGVFSNHVFLFFFSFPQHNYNILSGTYSHSECSVGYSFIFSTL